VWNINWKPNVDMHWQKWKFLFNKLTFDIVLHQSFFGAPLITKCCCGISMWVQIYLWTRARSFVIFYSTLLKLCLLLYFMPFVPLWFLKSYRKKIGSIDRRINLHEMIVPSVSILISFTQYACGYMMGSWFRFRMF
jgi:hypothetical protein